MKLTSLIVSFLFTLLCAGPGLGQAPSENTPKPTEGTLAEPFSGRIVFHQKLGHVIYDVTVASGVVSGHQFIDSDPKPIADIVGGWFDYKKGRLCLLIQGTAEGIDQKWRSQAQHFSIDLKAKEVTLEHMLYDYGLTADTLPDTPTPRVPHVLDSLDGTVHLVNQD